MGTRSVMVTSGNLLTAGAIASEAGVDDFLAQATPNDKLEYIRNEQAGDRSIAMTGDGTNDAPALAQADFGLAMNSETPAAKEVRNMEDLGNHGYNATESDGSNYGPTNPKLVERAKAAITKFQKDNPDYKGPIQSDLVTASAGGFGPGISVRTGGTCRHGEGYSAERAVQAYFTVHKRTKIGLPRRNAR